GAVQPRCLACLVVTDEDDVRPAGQFQQHAGSVSVAPQAGAVVDVEGDQGPSGAACGQFPHQVQAAGGEGRRDARQVQDASGAHGRQVDAGGAHRGGGRAGPVVGDLVGVVGPVAGGAEVDAGGAVRVAAHVRHVDARGADRLDEVVAEAVGAEDRKSTRLNSSHVKISYAVFCLK